MCLQFYFYHLNDADVLQQLVIRIMAICIEIWRQGLQIWLSLKPSHWLWHVVVSINWGIQNGWFTKENPIKMDDLWGHPYFRKPPFVYVWFYLTSKDIPMKLSEIHHEQHALLNNFRHERQVI